MILLENIEIALTSNVKAYYKSLGYVLPEKCRGKFIVKSTDLPPSSGTYVTRVCDECHEHHKMKRVKYRAVCRKCTSPKINKARRDPSKTTCPKCNSPKSYVGKVCKACVDQSGENNGMFGKKNPSATARNKSKNPEDHWNWKGGISRDRSGKQIHWSKCVKEEGGYLCQCCGYARKISLEAHHFTFSESKKMSNFDVSNGVALCSNCHKEFHKLYGYGENTKEQYLKFKGDYHANVTG